MLNMAQESAARVLTAERRAVALAASLEAAKEDGVAALLRLKAIMEVRVWIFLSLSPLEPLALAGCLVNVWFFLDFAGVRTIRAVRIGVCEALCFRGGFGIDCVFLSPDVGDEGPFQILNLCDWDLDLVG
jgi:hypothetical protein